MSVQFVDQGIRRFDGEHLLQIAMPIGGIGAGCVSLSGNGGLQDFATHNKPAITALPDGHGRHESAFALLHIKGDEPITKLVEGPLPPEKVYDQGLKGQGYRQGGHEGLPRFERATFDAEYPFGHVHLSHARVPLDVKVTGFSPFIPLDDRSSGMPCAILVYTLTNPTDAPVEFELSYHMSHMAPASDHRKGDRNTPIDGFGIAFTNTEHPDAERFGSLALGVIGHTPRIKAMWVRSGWFDWINALWREVSTGTFTGNDGKTDGNTHGHNGGSILMPGKLDPGASVTYPIVMTWHFPNCHYDRGTPPAECGDDCACHGEGDAPPAPKWKPYYAGQWPDARAVALEVRDRYAELRRRTRAFRDGLASSDLPPVVIDAISSNLAILKSPTVLRQANGNVWAWEGCFCEGGCCPGSCTHVWNYAQAMPHLFPPLERTFREQELERSMDEQGHINFRAALPDGPTRHDHHPAADGQLGGIMKVYRDWQISGDDDWLSRMFPLVHRSIDYCIARWDPDERGALFEPHHNTYDIEFWGPDGMCTSIYIGALCAMAELCVAVDRDDLARRYRDLAARGAAYMDEHLYNGAYYMQRVMWDDLRDQSFAQAMSDVDDNAPELDRILKAQGPKHQYANGCLSDGVIGAWMARMYGIDTPMTPAPGNPGNVVSTLKAIHKYNFKLDLFEHACTQRPGYAMGHEPGLILCTWPHGDRPTLPFVYSDEVWTGIEYQVAAHCLAEGLVDEGLEIVQGVRDRYEGHVRNPFNEYECGNFYARAMASYALLAAMTGIRYSAVQRTLHLERDFQGKAFLATATGWGTVNVRDHQLTIELVEGELAAERVVCGRGDSARTLDVHVTATAGESATINLT